MEELRDKKGLTEAEAIAAYRTHNYPKPAMTADIVIFRQRETAVQLLLIRRGGHPFLGKWATPGGFANENEPIETTARRELEEETGVRGLPLQLVDVFSAPGRDPRGWTVSVAFCAVVTGELAVKAGDDAADAAWFTLHRDGDSFLLSAGDITLRPEELAFDHGEILKKALQCAKIQL